MISDDLRINFLTLCVFTLSWRNRFAKLRQKIACWQLIRVCLSSARSENEIYYDRLHYLWQQQTKKTALIIHPLCSFLENMSVHRTNASRARTPTNAKTITLISRDVILWRNATLYLTALRCATLRQTKQYLSLRNATLRCVTLYHITVNKFA